MLQISLACASRRPSVRLSSRRSRGSCRRSAAVPPACLPTTTPAVCSSWWRTAARCPRPIPNASSPTRPTRPRASLIAVRSSSVRTAPSSSIRISRLCRRRVTRRLRRRSRRRRNPKPDIAAKCHLVPGVKIAV